ncbi:MAG: hypothetical protein JXA30_22230 [Deltaproteobacteria bacterium]|nr:hypothetical protein [Deltaproteobacteria bacterium]
MSRSTLAEQTQFLQREIGSCLLVVKCYELLENAAEARRIAGDVIRGEVERLAEMGKRSFPFLHISEQFLRVVYALEVSGDRLTAKSFYKSFYEAAVKRVLETGPLYEPEAHRLVVAQVVLDEKNTNVLKLLLPESMEWRISKAWSSEDRSTLGSCIEEIEFIITASEVDGSISPIQDGWLYILLHRMQVV